MSPESPARPPAGSPAERLAETLAARGPGHGFGVPGGGNNLQVIGELQARGLDFVLAHGESAACMMASTYGAITGRPAPVVVTRGPGAASAVNGAAQATLDRQPLVLVTDTVSSVTGPATPHQRLDQRAMLGPVTRASIPLTTRTTADELSALIDGAVGPPSGAVHLDYDADAEPVPVPDLRPAQPSDPEPVRSAVEAVGRARHPLVVVGLAANDHHRALRPVLESFGAPVLSTYQATGVLPTEHELAAGPFTNGALERELIEQADLLVAVGLDPVEPLSRPWPYDIPVVGLNPYPTDPYFGPAGRSIIGPLAELAAEVLQADHDWSASAGADHRRRLRDRLTRSADDDRSAGSGLVPTELVEGLVAGTEAVDDLTVTVDAGAHFLAIMPLWPVADPRRLLISNGLATMGYALPAAIGAALARPGEPVLCMTGDGGLGMVTAELETAVRLELPITVVVFNDARLSLIEIKQRAGQGGEQAVGYHRSDFAALARSVGMAGTTIESLPDLERILSSSLPSHPRLLDVRVDPTQYRRLITTSRG